MAITLPESAKKLLSTTMPDEKKEIEPSSSDPMTVAIETAKPILAKASFGSVVGFCSGYAVKQAGKLTAVVLGTGFIALQTLASLGYIDVNWTKVKDDAIKSVDVVSIKQNCSAEEIRNSNIFEYLFRSRTHRYLLHFVVLFRTATASSVQTI